MSVTISVDYGNGASKSFVVSELPGSSLWDVLNALEAVPPGLAYEFSDGTSASDRGGLSFLGTIISVDGHDEESSEWQVFVNDERATELFTAEHSMAEGRERPLVADGDAVLIKLAPKETSE